MTHFHMLVYIVILTYKCVVRETPHTHTHRLYATPTHSSSRKRHTIRLPTQMIPSVLRFSATAGLLATPRAPRLVPAMAATPFGLSPIFPKLGAPPGISRGKVGGKRRGKWGKVGKVGESAGKVRGKSGKVGKVGGKWQMWYKRSWTRRV